MHKHFSMVIVAAPSCVHCATCPVCVCVDFACYLIVNTGVEHHSGAYSGVAPGGSTRHPGSRYGTVPAAEHLHDLYKTEDLNLA